MSGEIKYKISLDADVSGGAQVQKALNGVAQAGTATAQVLSGNVAGAFVSAKNAFNSLKAAFIANPFTAALFVLSSIASVVASTMWQNYKKGIEDSRKAIDELIERRRRLLGLDRPLLDRARDEAEELSKSGNVEALKSQAEKARALAARQKNLAADRDKEAADYQANIGRGASEAMVLEAKRQAEALRTSALEFELIADLYEKGAKLTAERLEKERKEAADLAASNALKEKLAARRREDLVEDAERATDLRKKLIGKSEEEQIRIKIDDALARNAVISSRMRREDTSPDEIAAYTAELESITAEIEELNGKLKEIEDTRAQRLEDVAKSEAEYEFSRLLPDQQLAAINARMKEIMGEAGWEKDAAARAELLDLRKRRDELLALQAKAEEKQKKKKSPKEEISSRTLSDDEAIAVLERLRRARLDDVIRMRGSRTGGFMDDGVRRMAGSLAGGFSSRLRPSAFAHTAAELDAKRKGIATITEERTGAEQPVEIKGDAINYLRIIAGVLGKEA